MLQVGVAVLPSAAHLGVEGIRHRRRQLVLHLLLFLVYRWCDVILNVALVRDTQKQSWPEVVMDKDTLTCW